MSSGTNGRLGGHGGAAGVARRVPRVATWLWRAAHVAGLALAVAALPSCGQARPDEDPPEVTCKPGESMFEKGICHPAGLPPDMPPCPPGESELEGGGCHPAGLPAEAPICPPGFAETDGRGCQAAGIPEDACGPGFEPDGEGGCSAVLPESCPTGLMAVPGEAVCREVAPCGEGEYGDIPVEANMQFVNGTYAGGDSDGTAQKPWTTIGAAIAAAEPGAIVAIAAGQYTEDLEIEGKAVRLWGKCPAEVEIAGTSAAPQVIHVFGKGAIGSEVRDLAITGPTHGVLVNGANSVGLSRVWLHDLELGGIVVKNDLDQSDGSAVVDGALVEACGSVGVMASGTELKVTASVIRGTTSGSFAGLGVLAMRDGQVRGNMSVVGSVLEGSSENGARVSGSDLVIEGSVVRGTAGAGDPAGVHAEASGGERPVLEIHGSSIEANEKAGIDTDNAELLVERTVVRGTLPKSGQRGIGVACFDSAAEPEGPLSITIDSSVVEDSHAIGVGVIGARALLRATIVRRTAPQTVGPPGGYGVMLASDEPVDREAKAIVDGCILSDNTSAGVLAQGADLEITGTMVSATQPSPKAPYLGRGVEVSGTAEGKRGVALVRHSIIEDSHAEGMSALGSDAIVEGTIVQGTQPIPQTKKGGWGIAAHVSPTNGQRSNVVVRDTLISKNRAIGVVVDGSDVTLERTRVEDTLPDLAPEGPPMGIGVVLQDNIPDMQTANLTVLRSVVAGSEGAGMDLMGGVTSIDGCAVVDTIAEASGKSGRGVQLRANPVLMARANVTMRRSLVARNRHAGVVVEGSDLVLESTVVSDTDVEEVSGSYGRGLSVQYDAVLGLQSTAAVRDCQFEDNREAGVAVLGSDATIERTLVMGTQPGGGKFGDGVVVLPAYRVDPPLDVFATAQVSASALASNARVGASVFGSVVTLRDTALTCNVFDLEKEPYGSTKPEIVVEGEVQCGCPEAGAEECGTATAHLEPPEAIGTDGSTGVENP